MSKAVTQKVDELFQATKDLQSFDEIKPHCEAFNEWLNTNTSYSQASLGTVLSRAGLYKKFKSLPLEQGKNAESVPKHDGQGNIKGHELKHYVLLLCGLDDKDWADRNETTRVSDRLTTMNEDGSSGIEIDPDEYIQITGQLLSSDNLHELAVGLIAATGRRPHEILARGKFTAVEDNGYQVIFEGQGKKRGEKPVFKISTLFPAEYIIECLARLRKDASIKELLKEVSNQFPSDISAQNKAIEDKRGNSLRRIVQEYFGGKDAKEPLLNFRYGQDQNDCKALRAACAALVTERDCKGSTGAKILFASQFLGHITPSEKVSDKDLQHLATTAGYLDYYVNKSVGFPPMPEKDRDCNVKVSLSDLEFINTLRDERKTTQRVITSMIIERYKNSELMAKELQELRQQNSQLKAEIEQLKNQEIKPVELVPQVIDIDAIAKLIDERIAAALTKQSVTTPTLIPATTPSTESIDPVTTAEPTPTKKDTANWEHLSNADLWESKNTGVAAEKVRRSFEAICLYNDTLATDNSNRIAITNLALRELSGVNGMVVKDWLESHKDEVISHNSKYEMGNRKDPGKLETYANKGKDVSTLLKIVSDKFLDGVAIK